MPADRSVYWYTIAHGERANERRSDEALIERSEKQKHVVAAR